MSTIEDLADITILLHEFDQAIKKLPEWHALRDIDPVLWETCDEFTTATQFYSIYHTKLVTDQLHMLDLFPDGMK